MAGGFAGSASNIRARLAELEDSGAGAPASWGWSGAAAAAYTRTWQSWRTGAQVLADRMEVSARVLNELADELERAQRMYDDAVTRAQTLGLGVDARGYVTPRPVAAPTPLASGSPDQQVEADLATAARLGKQTLDWTSEQLHAIFDDGYYKAIDKINNILGWAQLPATILQTGTAVYAGAKLLQSERNLAGIATRLFSETVGPVGLAYDRGEASAARLMEAAAQGLNRMEWARAFTVNADRASFLRSGFPATGALDTLGRFMLPLGAVADVLTFINPGPGGEGEQTVVRAAAAVNFAATGVVVLAPLLLIDAGLAWIPVVGEVALVATGVILAADWAYNNVKPFHDFCNAAGSETVHVAQDAWNSASHTASDVSHGVTNAVSGAAHALTGFFHWP
jgi:uncharacterized protein YukE